MPDVVCERDGDAAIDYDAAKRVATLQRVAWALRGEQGTVTTEFCEQHAGWHVNVSDARPIDLTVWSAGGSYPRQPR